ncbi:amidohydrolase [Zafaria sp. Z1313]|uniref:amidohydrolase n=1 Tax=unclassified Zafaria TaxID=2828765 RepID=UPI002E7A0011|nr:amidohydrolase family protein [Zafaria sp. J156]MEE1621201.1 amidohydrolase family protein [Zafaria sp. J156]
MPQRVMYRNGAVYSASDPFATALLVADGTVAWIGQEAAAAALLDEGVEVVDLEGALVAPAFFDSHVHLTETGAALSMLDLGGVGSLAGLLEAVRGAAASGGAVFGAGWDESLWPEGRVPTPAELEEAGGGADVYLTRADVHSGLVNASLAGRLALAGVDGYDGGAVVVREAHARVRAEVLDFSDASRRRFQRAALRHLASRGVAGAAEMGAPHIGTRRDTEVLLGLLEKEGQDHPAIHVYWGEAVADAAQARSLMEDFGGRLTGLGGDLNIDGSLGSRTARLRADYDDAPGSRGDLFLDAGRIADHIAACTEAGIQAAFHVIGDAGADAAIEGFRLAAERVGRAAVQSARHRLEHVEMIDDAVLAALLEYGITVSLQPAFDALWGGPGGQYEQRLGVERSTAMNEVGRFLAAGVPVCLGSDAPVTAVDPWGAVKACLEHHTPSARVSARAAFVAHTRAGHRAAGVADPLAGQLVPGAEATFAVWEASELAVQAPDARVASWSTDARAGTPMLPVLDEGAPRCLRTVRAGRVIFDAFETR